MIWTAESTSTHQDHVIAHVVGANVLGYFIFEESLYVLLDIGFIWRIYLDLEMGLLPAPVAIQELEADNELKQVLKTDCDILAGGDAEQALTVMGRAHCFIEQVNLFVAGGKRLLTIDGRDDSLSIETSFLTRQISVEQMSSGK